MISVVPENMRRGVVVVCVFFLWLRCAPARANGRFPGADQLIADPIDSRHLVVRTTFGFVSTRDAGAHWSWICEEIVGRIGTADPPIAVMGDGTIVVAVPFEGCAVSHDDGCTWSRAPDPLAGQLVVDMTLEPNDPASLLVLTSTNDPTGNVDAGLQFVTRVVETNDDGRTWAVLGRALPRDFIATTIEVAGSDPRRLYVGGVVGDPPSAAVETSVDRGLTWTRTTLATATPIAGAFVSAVDPRDEDRLWLRIMSSPVDAFGMAPTALRVTHDMGATWSDVAATEDSMFGFALSPDGTRVAYGGEQEGVYVGSSDGSGSFERVSELKNRCLTWTPEGLYACGTEPIDPFAVGRSIDADRSYEALYRLADTCPQACPAESLFNQVCRTAWTDAPNGVALLTGATAQACSVPWAQVSAGDAGASDRTRDAGRAGDEAGPGAPRLDAGGGCSCTMRRASGPPSEPLRETRRKGGTSQGRRTREIVTLGAILFSIAWARRRRRVSQGGGAGS